MDISDVKYSGGILPSQGANKVQSAKTTKGGQVASEIRIIDRAEIDRIARDDARILEGARLVLDASPEIRHDKVAEAKKKLAEGFYDKPAVKGQIAANMAKEPEAYPVTPPLSEEALKEVKTKIKSDFYSQTDVKSDIAQGMIQDALESDDE